MINYLKAIKVRKYCKIKKTFMRTIKCKYKSFSKSNKRWKMESKLNNVSRETNKGKILND